METKVLVTGSAGHLGEALMRTFRAAERPAVGLDIKASPFTDQVGSIVDRALVKRCMRDVKTVIHAATLHKPHIATHTMQDFVETNITGTLVLLEEAAAAGVECFLYTSTTSAFGDALSPAAGEPAAWITEEVTPIPKNIYGVTKLAAESLCELFFRKHHLPTLVLRTSRIRELGWQPRHDFQHVLDCLKRGVDFRSPLAREVGSKGYHSKVFAEGPYPVKR